MNVQIYEEATQWLIINRDSALDAAEKRRFDAWLRESPQHVRAYLEMSAIWEDVPSLERQWNPEAPELIASARGDDNIHPLLDAWVPTKSPSAPIEKPPAPLPLRSWSVGGRTGLFALAATVLIGVIGLTLWYQSAIYDTGIGEQRSIVLADGSKIELNSRSRIRVRYGDERRDVDLLEGQALFRVAHNAARPFVVHTGNSSIRAVGTAFDVYRKRAGIIVTVVEGKVALTGAGDEPHAAVLLAAGEQLTVPAEDTRKPPASVPPQRANVAVATAWTQGTLVFESSSLTEVAEEFNRYNKRQLLIEDPRLASFLVSGVFSSADPGLLIKFLRAQPELAVTETQTQIRIDQR